MEMRQIRYFQCVAQELSFTKAAARLHIAQPPLSRQIRQLEEELGVELFERLGRSIRLTDAGKFFFDKTLQLATRLDDVVLATRRIAESGKKWFGIGFVPSIMYGFGPRLFSTMQSIRAQAEIGLSEMTTVEQLQALRARHIDIGFGRLVFDAPDLQSLRLINEPLVLAVPVSHYLADKPQVVLDDIDTLSYVLYPAKPRPSYADQVMGLFEQRGRVIKVVFEANEMQTAIGLVAAGMGVTLVPESVRRMNREDVIFIPLNEPEFTSPILMTWRKDSTSHLLQSVIELAQKVADDMSR